MALIYQIIMVMCMQYFIGVMLMAVLDGVFAMCLTPYVSEVGGGDSPGNLNIHEP